MPLNRFLGLNPSGSFTNRELAEKFNDMLLGHTNNLFEVTLTASTTMTVAISQLLGPESHLTPMPLTANASLEIGAGTLHYTAQGTGTITLEHANSAQTDRSFRFKVVG